MVKLSCSARVLVTSLMLLATALPLNLGAQMGAHPLSKETVLKFLNGDVSPHRVAAIARERGIVFQVTPDVERELRQVGATEELIATLRELAPKPSVVGPTPGEVRENPKDGLKYVWIPPGTFMMGCSPGDTECARQEKPSHQVTITRGFWIGQTPVTVGAYKRFVGATGQPMPPETDYFGQAVNPGWADDAMPIVNVTWDEAQVYCGWAGGRLPTEAQWEYAARGGSTEARYGSIYEVAWYSSNSGNKRHDVAKKRANGFGLFDMLGNVSEWVYDWFDSYQNIPSQDPSGPASGEQRVVRGADWGSDPRWVRVSARFFNDHTRRLGVYGFRCAAELVTP